MLHQQNTEPEWNAVLDEILTRTVPGILEWDANQRREFAQQMHRHAVQMQMSAVLMDQAVAKAVRIGMKYVPTKTRRN
jgi:hypothetical protein